jgi:hypothetical protein
MVFSNTILLFINFPPGSKRSGNRIQTNPLLYFFILQQKIPNVRIQMTVVKSVNILSVAKIGALFGIVMGLVWGIFFGTIAASRIGRIAPGMGAMSGIALIVIMPVMGVIVGFIGGAIHAFLYNVFAGWVGGINLEFQQ